MFTNQHWSPYIIPPCLTPEGGKNYTLSFSDKAEPTKNPSQFLEWKETVPNGTNLGDIIYWDPSAGDGGAWVALPAPSGSGLKVLTANDGTLAWADTQDC